MRHMARDSFEDITDDEPHHSDPIIHDEEPPEEDPEPTPPENWGYAGVSGFNIN